MVARRIAISTAATAAAMISRRRRRAAAASVTISVSEEWIEVSRFIISCPYSRILAHSGAGAVLRQ
jgi:hypothetical protein